MRSRSVAVLLCIAAAFFFVVVRADEPEQTEAAPAEAPVAAPPKKSHKKPKASEPLTPESLPPLGVQPLSVDSAALRNDDELFAAFKPGATKGSESVAALTASLSKANNLLNKMQMDLEGEKVWTKNVYDIIQNYQYKYLRTSKDVRNREKRVAKMVALVKNLKASALHAGVTQELARAAKALDELVTRSGGSGESYRRLADRMGRLRAALRAMPRKDALHNETTRKMKHILSTQLPPRTADALKNLVSDAAEASPKKAAKKAAKKVAKKAAKKAAPKKGAKKGAKKAAAPKKAVKKA